jgi:hypothetical protein
MLIHYACHTVYIHMNSYQFTYIHVNLCQYIFIRSHAIVLIHDTCGVRLCAVSSMRCAVCDTLIHAVCAVCTAVCDGARGRVWLCGSAAVCGSAALYGSAHGCLRQCTRMCAVCTCPCAAVRAVMCSSACSSVRQ